MACNAYNHRPGCDCGWGGIFHGLGLISDRFYWSRLESYTTPNARCPHCSVPVFFYRSPEGGSVYFESLGPPWPKHPCMDGQNEIRNRAIGTSSTSVSTWEKEGWHPMNLEAIGSHKSSDLIIVLTLSNQKQLYTQNREINISLDAPILWRRVENMQGQIEISTLNIVNNDFKEIRILEFEKLDELLNWIQTKRLEADTKVFEAEVESLATEFLKDDKNGEIKSQWDKQVAVFRHQLHDQQSLAQVVSATRKSLSDLIQKYKRIHEKALLTFALENVLRNEMLEVLEEFPQHKKYLVPALKQSINKALRSEMSIEASKELMRQAAKDTIAALERAEQKAALHAVLKTQEASIVNAFTNSGFDLAPILRKVIKRALDNRMFIESSKELMWKTARKSVNKFNATQEHQNIITSLNSHMELIAANSALDEKGKKYVSDELQKALSSSVINAEQIKQRMEDCASIYLKSRVVETTILKNQRVQTPRNIKRTLPKPRLGNRRPFNTALADKLMAIMGTRSERVEEK
jgi:hypothetical protein